MYAYPTTTSTTIINNKNIDIYLLDPGMVALVWTSTFFKILQQGK